MNDQELLLPGERIDDLQLMGLRIIQSPDAFRFGMDAVLLADFAAVRKNSRVQNIKVQMYVYRTGTGVFRYSAGT